jgi:hypothetical protein
MEEDGTGATPWQGPGRSFSGKTTSIWRRGFVIGDERRQRKSGDGRQTGQGEAAVVEPALDVAALEGAAGERGSS